MIESLNDYLEENTKEYYYKGKEKNYRYILGTTGDRPLICIGTNPSDAINVEDKTDKTIDRVKAIQEYNKKYDSWIMLNLYPEVSEDVSKLPNEADSHLSDENLGIIKDVLIKISQYYNGNSFDVWCAWGSSIEEKQYFKCALNKLYEALKNEGLKINWIQAKSINPRHPVTTAIEAEFEKFDLKKYIEPGRVGKATLNRK